MSDYQCLLLAKTFTNKDMCLKNMTKKRSIICLMLILVFSFFLRFIGAGWGLQYNGIQKVNPHFDEGFYSVNFCKEIDLQKKNLISENSQKDGGSLTYYLWTLNALLFKTAGLLDKMPAQLDNYGQDYTDFIYYSRLLMVLFDTLSVALIFLIVKKITGNKKTALFAALVFAIIPFEIMHSNFMRPHILVNFFVLLIIYLSLFIYEKKQNRLVCIDRPDYWLMHSSTIYLCGNRCNPCHVLLLASFYHTKTRQFPRGIIDTFQPQIVFDGVIHSCWFDYRQPGLAI